MLGIWVNTKLLILLLLLLLYDVSQKVPTFKLTATLSNLNRFSNFLHSRKAYEICYKIHTTILISP